MTPWAQLSPAAQGAGYAIMAGLVLTSLDAVMKSLTTSLPPYQTQCLRNVMGLVVMLPLIWREGLLAWRPHGIAGQAWRGAVHTAGLTLWFTALPHIPLADVTALGFTTPLFTMLGAVLIFRERAGWRRWVAAGFGFLGVVIVVAPGLSGAGGQHNLIMLAAAPLFAASALITKALTRRDRPQVIVAWQALTIALFSLPLALTDWRTPSGTEWLLLLACGALGSLGQFCLTRSLLLADVSATQPLKFLTILWAAAYGWLLFAQTPSQTTLAGALVIFAATTWITRSEARRARQES